jgi:hypothetical protein
MRRTSRFCLLLLCATPAWASAATAAGFACPETLRLTPMQHVELPSGWAAVEEAENHYLRGARLFDGPMRDQADLIGERGGWDLSPNEGRGYTLVCQYEGTELTLAATLPAGLKRCAVTRRKANWRGVRYGREVTDGTEILVHCQ